MSACHAGDHELASEHGNRTHVRGPVSFQPLMGVQAVRAMPVCLALSAGARSQIKMLADNPDQWAMLLGAAFPNSSNFFLNYVIARAFMMNLFRLIMPRK